MKINAKIKYNEEYLPTKRHRIPRIREIEETIEVELKEIKKDDAKLAFIVKDYKSYLDENGTDRFGLKDTEYFAVGQDLFIERRDMGGALDKGEYKLESLIKHIQEYGNWGRWHYGDFVTKENAVKGLNEFLEKHVLIGDKVYKKTNEPRYYVITFGLGHNHGGTSLSIGNHYNSNLSKNSYFNALQREEAIAYANKVAAGRGDTNDVGKFGKDRNIEVFMPEMVKCNPQLEHGEGNPFLNSMEELVSGSGSVMEAGLLVLAGTATEIKSEKPSLSEKIAGAKEKQEDGIKKEGQQKGKEMSF